jgi:hypothetical protein
VWDVYSVTRALAPDDRSVVLRSCLWRGKKVFCFLGGAVCDCLYNLCNSGAASVLAASL